ncbi:MAG: aryl-sulfate sulfohydrolase, partial [Verrucomicrobia bacterium]|nr:aryl-sulfate sulfohydrolase [Verrucomicrobiota bacterium]
AVELYNLRDDIGERNSLAASNPAMRDELLGDLLAWFKATDARLPTERNSDYVPGSARPAKKKKK